MTESSILKAYCKLINEAEHYIYIEVRVDYLSLEISVIESD